MWYINRLSCCRLFSSLGELHTISQRGYGASYTVRPGSRYPVTRRSPSPSPSPSDRSIGISSPSERPDLSSGRGLTILKSSSLSLPSEPKEVRFVMRSASARTRSRSPSPSPHASPCPSPVLSGPLLALRPWRQRPLNLWNKYDVGDWLESVGLAEHRQRFQEHEIEGSHLPALTKDDYVELGVTRLGHRINIERALRQLLDGSTWPLISDHQPLDILNCDLITPDLGSDTRPSLWLGYLSSDWIFRPFYQHWAQISEWRHHVLSGRLFDRPRRTRSSSVCVQRSLKTPRFSLTSVVSHLVCSRRINKDNGWSTVIIFKVPGKSLLDRMKPNSPAFWSKSTEILSKTFKCLIHNILSLFRSSKMERWILNSCYFEKKMHAEPSQQNALIFRKLLNVNYPEVATSHIALTNSDHLVSQNTSSPV